MGNTHIFCVQPRFYPRIKILGNHFWRHKGHHLTAAHPILYRLKDSIRIGAKLFCKCETLGNTLNSDGLRYLVAQFSDLSVSCGTHPGYRFGVAIDYFISARTGLLRTSLHYNEPSFFRCPNPARDGCIDKIHTECVKYL